MNCDYCNVTKLDITKVPLDCPKVWDLLCSGYTKGVFQLETNLGKTWCRNIKPRSIEELAAVISVIRPGTLKSKLEGKSLTHHFSDRKNGLEEIPEYHPIVDSILRKTYGILTYQEQAIRIVMEIADFTAQQADKLRKAIGKKIAKDMTVLREEFISGCEKSGKISKEKGEELFDWIEKSQRYSFNKSHAIAYALESYWCAYIKSHSKIEFFVSWLNGAKNKQDKYTEIRELIEDAKFLGIRVNSPNLLKGNIDFKIHDNTISYGLSHIKGVGESSIKKLISPEVYFNSMALSISSLPLSLQRNPIQETCEYSLFHWESFIIYDSNVVSSRVIEALISSGSLDYFEKTRTQMLTEYKIWKSLSKKEQEWVQENFDIGSFIDILEKLLPTKKNGGGTHNKNRSEIVKSQVQSLKNPESSTKDDPDWIINKEHHLLGIPLTYDRLDTHNVIGVTHTCKELLDGCQSKYIILGVEIQTINDYIIKNGKNKGSKMAFVTVSDKTCTLDGLVIFSSQLEEYKLELQENTVVTMKVQISKKGGFIITKIWNR